MKTTTICPTCGVEFTRTHTSYKPPRHCSRACANKAPGRMTAEVRKKISRTGPAHPNFKGGFLAIGGKRSSKQYQFMWVSPEERAAHPTTNARGYIHRSHMNWNIAHPDDPVLPGQIIHHRDEDSLNDAPENLEKMANQAEHARHHFSQPRKPLSEAHKRAISETKKRQAAERA